MVLTREEKYRTKAKYLISGTINVENEEFQLEVLELESPDKAYEIAQRLKRGGVKLIISQHIYFERHDGYRRPSDEKPVEREISIEQLEKICQGEDPLPIKTYNRVISLSARGADIGD